MLGDLIILAIIGYVIYYTYKYVIGALAPVLTGVIALYVIYIIYTHVMFGTVPFEWVTEAFIENDKTIEQTIEEYNEWEYKNWRDYESKD